MKVTPQAKQRMKAKPAWQQRKEALLEAIEQKHKPVEYPVPDADDESMKKRIFQ